MSTYYQPQEGVFPGRPPCATCGAGAQLHRHPTRRLLTSTELGRMADRGEPLLCPVAYRPATAEEAQRALEEAERSGDQARVFVARGEYQRLVGRK